MESPKRKVFISQAWTWRRPPYGLELSHMATAAREAGHEVQLCTQGEEEVAW